MKHGVIVQFRLNTEDVMSCVDVLNMSNVSKDNMSLSMLCKLVLTSYLHRLRTDGVVPMRDGFEYLNMIAPFVNVSQAKKSSMANVLPASIGTQRSEAKPQTQHQMKRTDDEFNTPEALLIKKKGRVMNGIIELEARRAADVDNFSPEQHKKLVALNTALVQLDNGMDVDIRTLLD